MLPVLLALQEHGTEETTSTNPVLPSVSELFWGAIAFFTLYALVKFVLLPPVQKVMQERADRIRDDLNAADVARDNAGHAATVVSDQLVGVRAEAAEAVDAARAEAEAERAKLVAEAEADVAKLRLSAEAEIESARAEAMAGIRPQVSELAASAASRLMNRTIDPKSTAAVVDRLLDHPN